MNEDLNQPVKCSACGAEMTSVEFNMHDCPNMPAVLSGESWEDYKKRASEFIQKDKPHE